MENPNLDAGEAVRVHLKWSLKLRTRIVRWWLVEVWAEVTGNESSVGVWQTDWRG